jgi:glycosyltransferase involved in cell wall biosynthesis
MKNYQPLISIIMNCYNSEKYLNEAIKSVLAQTYSKWEIIFWDNLSTDNSAKIVKSFNSKKIHYYKSKTHTNLGAARILATKKAHGDWLVFLDCDDVWFPHFLRLHLDQIRKSNSLVGAVYCRINYIDASNKLLQEEAGAQKFYPLLPSGNIHNLLIYENFIPFLSVMINTKFYFDVGGFDASLIQAEDFDLLIKLSIKCNFLAVEDVCASYRIHSKNNTIKNWEIGYLESEKSIFINSNSPHKKSAITKWKAERLILILFREGINRFLERQSLNKRNLDLSLFYWIFRVLLLQFIRKIQQCIPN